MVELSCSNHIGVTNVEDLCRGWLIVRISVIYQLSVSRAKQYLPSVYQLSTSYQLSYFATYTLS